MARNRGTMGRAKVLPQDAREHNRSFVLKHLIAHQLVSRADLARLTGLTRATVSALMTEMIDEGLVSEVGKRAANGRGKPATLLRVDEDSRHIVGVDLSDPQVFRAGVFRLDGSLVSSHTRQVGDAQGAESLEAASQLITRATR